MNSQKKTTRYLFVSSCLLLLLSCNEKTPPTKAATQTDNTPPMSRLPQDAAGETARKCIENFGGWDAWAAKKTVTYTKTSQSYDSTGKLLKERIELHQYQLNPHFKARISWIDSANNYVLINNGQQAWKFKNGVEMTAENDRKQAYNSTFGSHYVLCMPFKLTDPGTVLTDEGLVTLPKGKALKCIKTTYLKGAGSAAGMHTWWYLFDPQSGNLTANFLDYGDSFSFTDYTEFKVVDSIKLATVRKGYAMNAKREVRYLTAIYINKDFVFDKPMGDSLFEPLKNN